MFPRNRIWDRIQMDVIYFLKRKGEKQDRQWKALMRGCRSRWRPALAYPWGALGYELQQQLNSWREPIPVPRASLAIICSLEWRCDIIFQIRQLLFGWGQLPGKGFLVHAIGNQHQHHRGDRNHSPSQRDLARTPPAFSTARNILSEQDREFNRMDWKILGQWSFQGYFISWVGTIHTTFLMKLNDAERVEFASVDTSG